MLREVRRAVRIAVADVRRECKDDRQWIFLRMWLKYRRVERYAVAHGDLHCPAHIGNWGRGCGSLLSHASISSRAHANHCQQNHSMHNLISSHPTTPRRSSGQPFRAKSSEHTHGIASDKEFLL